MIFADNSGLKYQLDGYSDYHNVAEPSTTSCPYLPGQLVNILEVPVQLTASDNIDRPRSTKPITPTSFTLNPADKFLKLRPPDSYTTIRPTSSSVSAVRGGHEIPYPAIGDPCKVNNAKDCGRPCSLNNSRFSASFTKTSSSQQSRTIKRWSLPISNHRSSSKYSGQRIVQSAGAVPQVDQSSQSTIWNPRSFMQRNKWTSLSSFVRRSSARQVILPSPVDDILARCQLGFVDSGFPKEMKAPVRIESMPAGIPHQQPLDVCELPIAQLGPPSEKHPSSRTLMARDKDIDGLHNHLDQSHYDLAYRSYAEATCLGKLSISTNLNDQGYTSSSFATSFNYSPYREVPALASPYCNLLLDRVPSTLDSTKFEKGPVPNPSVMSSNTSQSVLLPPWSPTTFVGNMSPCYLSQPETPVVNESSDQQFGQISVLTQMLATDEDDICNRSVSYYGSGGFDGYSLSLVEHASALTLRDMPVSFGASSNEQLPPEQRNEHNLLDRWSDGAESRRTGPEGLFDDLGYLGSIVV